MHTKWRLLALPAHITDQADTLIRICVNHCVQTKESAMDFAMDLISIKAEATNKMMQYVPLQHQPAVATLIMDCTREYERVKQELCMELVSEGYELAPLELECIHSTLLRAIFSAYIPNIPLTFPLPSRMLLWHTGQKSRIN